MRVRCVVFAATLVCVLLPAASAHAATAYVAGRVLHFAADPGVADQVTVSREAASVWVSTALPFTAGTGCTVKSPGQILCDVSGFDSVDVRLGDMDDRLVVYPDLATPLTAGGGPGDDEFEDSAEHAAVSLDGGEGDDEIRVDSLATGFDDVYAGGDGRDTLEFTRAPSLTIRLDGVANDGAAGEHDNIAPDFEVVYGSSAPDVIEGSPGPDELHGGGGADVITGMGGDDTLYGSDGFCAHIVLDGGDGNDKLSLDGASSADGGPGDDTLVIPSSDCGHQHVNGGSGDDTLDFRAEQWPDVLVSLDGVADDGRSETDDFGSDIETVLGDDAGMELIGGPGQNRLVGGAGDDLLDGGGGTDVLIGGAGEDVADYSSHTGPLSLSLDGRANDGSAGEDDNLGFDVEDLRGGPGDDMLAGDDNDNVLDGGPGADVMSGAGGFDAADYSDRTQNVTVSLDGAARDDGEYGEGDTVSADVEGVFGGLGSDVLIGNGADGFLDGGVGNDFLTDRGGRDILNGGPEDDIIDGADGSQDLIACGTDTDVAYRDADDVATGCEVASLGPRPAPPPITIGSPRRPPVLRLPLTPPKRLPADTRAPHATIKVHGRLPKLRVVVTCDEACRVTATVTAQGHKRVLAKGALRTLATGRRTLRPKLTRRGRHAHHGRFRIALTLTDAAANTRHVAVHARL